MLFTYEQPDKPTIDLKTKFKVALYFYILGVTIVLKKYFINCIITAIIWWFCTYDIYKLKNVTQYNIMKNCIDPWLLLSDNFCW